MNALTNRNQAPGAETREPWRAALSLIWMVVRLPLLALVVILEPFVTIILMGVATLGVLTSLFNEFVLKLPHFPFGLMMAMSIGSALLLLPFYALQRFLAH